MDSKMNVTVSLTREIAELSKSRARDNGMTRSQLIELLLRQWLRRPYETPPDLGVSFEGGD